MARGFAQNLIRFTDLIGVFRSIPSDKSLGYFRTVRYADELIYFLGKAVARASCDSRDASATFDRGTEIVQLPSIP